MKYGIRNFPSITTFLKACNVGPSKGKEPHTNTYKTTPKLYKELQLSAPFTNKC